jgi:hypothetical protein
VPDFTIVGDPAAISARVATMEEKAAVFAGVADGLDALDTGGWTGRAADRFREKFHTEPGKWRDAGTGFRRAASALSTYAAALGSAQSRARWAEDEYHRGDGVTAQARSAYDADVDHARQEAAAANAAGRPTTLTIEPFHDPGAAIRQGALDELASARADLEAAAHACAAEVRAGCAGAPEKRNWLESGLAFVGGVLLGAGESVWDLVQMGFDLQFGPMLDMLDLATGELTPEELAAKNQLEIDQAEALLSAIKDDPLEFGKNLGKSLLDWDTWSDDPARALGHLVPDLVVTLASGGAGASVRALRGLEGLHDISLLARPLHGLRSLRGLDLHDLTGLSHLDDAALAARIDSLSVADQARLLRRGEDMTPQSMESIFNPRFNGAPNDLRFFDNTYAGGAPRVASSHPLVDDPLVNLHGTGDPGSGTFWTDPSELLHTRTEAQAMDRMALRPEWYTKDAPGGGYQFSHRDEITVRDFSSREDMRMDAGPIAPQNRAEAVADWARKHSTPAPEHFDGAPVPDRQPGGATQYLSGLDDPAWTSNASTWTGPAPWVTATPEGAWAGFGAGATAGAAGSVAAGAAAEPGPAR